MDATPWHQRVRLYDAGEATVREKRRRSRNAEFRGTFVESCTLVDQRTTARRAGSGSAPTWSSPGCAIAAPLLAGWVASGSAPTWSSPWCAIAAPLFAPCRDATRAAACAPGGGAHRRSSKTRAATPALRRGGWVRVKVRAALRVRGGPSQPFTPPDQPDSQRCCAGEVGLAM